MIFDTHCHGYWRGLDNREAEVRGNMQAAGVMRSIQIGTDWESSLRALELAQRWGPGTWCTVGMHPSDCQDLSGDSAEEWVAKLEPLIQQHRDKVVGIGETGLDYFHLTRGNKEAQKQAQQIFFEAQAALASRWNLPLVIHTRDAAADLVALIKRAGVKRAIIHCFSQDLEFAQKLLAWSEEIYFSFSGILTYKKSVAIQEAARALRLDRILIETDSPFLVPQAVRDRFTVNEPAFTLHVMDFLKTLRQEPPDVVEQAVWENSHRVFRIEM